MKIVPILAITNALALGLVILLFVQHEDLKSQLKSTRSSPVRTSSAVDRAEMLDLMREEWMAYVADGTPTLPPPPDLPSDAEGAETEGESRDPDGSMEGGPSDNPFAGRLEGEAMERFRRNVRLAMELNNEEDRIENVVERLDRLIGDNKIGPLSAQRKERVARTLLSARDRIPNIWRTIRNNPEMRELPREERSKIVRLEYETLRADAQKELEEIVPAADAKTIMEDGFRGGDMFPGRGPRSRGR